MTRHDPQSELAHYIARLNRAWHLIPEVRQGIAERIADAATPTPGQGSGSGISRPTEAAARRIEGLQDADRAILGALRSLGKAIDHLDLECRRGLGTHRADTSQEPRCPVMELHVSNEQAGPRGTVMVRCGAISEAKLDERGTAVGWDPDGYCAKHRAQANRLLSEADAALAATLRRKLKSA